MPTRRKATESQAPATTPKKSKNKNGGGMGVSQKYTAYVKERPTDFSREEEILQQLLENSLQDNDSSDYAGKILLIPPLPLDHGVGTRGIDDNQTNQMTPMNHHHPGPGIFRRGYDSLVGLLAKGLNLIGFTIFLIFWGTRSGFELVWRSLPRRNSKSNNRFLIFLILITILIILLISSEGSKTVLNRLLPSHLRFWDVTTYKIQFQHYDDYNHNNDSDSSITLTYEDLRKIIETEVRNHLKKSEGEKGVSSSPVGSAEIRNLVSHEVKQITNEYKHVISSEVKKEIKHIRTDIPRLRGNIKEDYILEIIRNEARKVVAEALLVFSQDKLNKPDFALHSGGAKVMSRYTSKTYEKWPNEWYKKVFAYLTGRVVRGKPPVTAISPNTHVGECWPFPGQEGQLAILLNRRVYVTAVTYDHVSRDVAVEVQSAPKEFEVWGIVDDGVKGYKHEMNDDPDEEIYMESTDDECSVRQDGEFVPDKNKNHLSKNNYSNDDSNLANDELHIDNLGSSPLHLFLGSFTYNISSLPVQTFEVPQDANKPVRTVIMKVLNNWGKPGYTCLYRFRVHGNPADKSDN